MIGYAIINDGTKDIPIDASDIEVHKKNNRKTEYGLTGSRNPSLTMAGVHEYEGTIEFKSVAKGDATAGDGEYFARLLALVLGSYNYDDTNKIYTAVETDEPTLPSFSLKYGIKELNIENEVTGAVVKSFKMGYKSKENITFTISFVATGLTIGASGSYSAPPAPANGWVKFSAPNTNVDIQNYAFDIFEFNITVDNDVEVIYPLNGSQEPKEIKVNKRKKSGKISFRTNTHSDLDSLIESDSGQNIAINNNDITSSDNLGGKIEIDGLLFGEYTDKVTVGDNILVFDMNYEAKGEMKFTNTA